MTVVLAQDNDTKLLRKLGFFDFFLIKNIFFLGTNLQEEVDMNKKNKKIM